MTDEIRIHSEEGRKEVSETRELLTEVKELFGRSALTTEVEDADHVRVNGNDWQVQVGRDGELAFKPAGASLRFVRRATELREVRQEPRSVSFVFQDEVLTVGRGLEHRKRR